jgi:hypothetical protein
MDITTQECPECGWDFIEECKCGHKAYLNEQELQIGGSSTPI